MFNYEEVIGVTAVWSYYWYYYIIYVNEQLLAFAVYNFSVV